MYQQDNSELYVQSLQMKKWLWASNEHQQQFSKVFEMWR